MQRCEYESTTNERKSSWYACKQRRPLRLAKHWYQREAEKNVSGRKHYVLPATLIADQRK